MKLSRPIQFLITDTRRHLVCLPYKIKNLHMMAAQVGIGRQWFHRDHYDLPVRRRVQIEQASLQVSPKVIVRLIHAHNSMRVMMDASTMEQGMDHEAKLLRLFKEQGKAKAHFCPSWHGMAIHEQSIEFEACQCDEDKLQKG